MNRRAAGTTPLETVVGFGCSLIAVLAFVGLTPTVSSALEPVHAATVSALATPALDNGPTATGTGTRTGTDTATDRAGPPPITANDFLPEDRDVTDCIGSLERPGCGSERRGGWRQYAVLGAIGLGLVIVFFNVVRGVRNRNLS